MTPSRARKKVKATEAWAIQYADGGIDPDTYSEYMSACHAIGSEDETVVRVLITPLPTSGRKGRGK